MLVKIALAITCFTVATVSHAISITAQNKCDKPVPYKVERKGSTLNTSLSQRTSTSHSLDSGDRIKVGSNVIHTVPSSSQGQTVVICNK